MHFSLILVTGLAAFATALPHQPSGGRGGSRDEKPSPQDAQGNGLQSPDAQPPTVVPYNPQAGNQGSANGQAGLNNQGAGNANQNGTATGNNGQDQNGQNQNGQIQNPTNQTSGFDPSLVPEFGIQAGQSPDGTGNCLGLNNVKIPCGCPPDRQDFIKRVQAAAAAGNSAGVPVKFPLDDSSASKKARIQTSIIVLQNLNGRGVGCPAAATTFLQQQAAA